MRKLSVCQKHGEGIFVYEPSGKGRWRCKKCRNGAVTKRRKKMRQMLIERFGGKCVICDYNKCTDALVFHHKDPSQKEFGLSAKGQTRSFEKAVAEAEKCELVCVRCHSEIHAGLYPEFLILSDGSI